MVTIRPQVTDSLDAATISHSLVCAFPDASSLDKCLSVHPPAAGDALVGPTRCRSVWLRLLQSPAFNAVVISRPDRPRHCVGFGASVFVSSSFATDERTNPRPGLNARLIAAVDADQSVVLTAGELARGNAAGNLSLLILYSAWRRDGLSDREVEQIKTLLASTFFEAHLGYGMKEWMSEASDAVQIAYAHATAVWNVRVFDKSNMASSTDFQTAFLYVDSQHACRRAGSIPALMFLRRVPIFGLRGTSQEVLRHALRGHTDDELARMLGITRAAVKKRWIRIFDDVERQVPSFGNASPSRDSVRGPQRRHHLLAYVREHPEELRPFRTRPRSEHPKA